jgi:hypothetical protein
MPVRQPLLRPPRPAAVTSGATRAAAAEMHRRKKGQAAARAARGRRARLHGVELGVGAADALDCEDVASVHGAERR